MNKFLKHLPKIATAMLAGVLLATSLSATAQATFGPDRPTRVWSTQENGFNYVTFNSFTGVPNGIGDERAFFNGVQVGIDPNWTNPVQNVKQDAEVEGKIYIHNNADPNLNSVSDGKGSFVGIAHNVTVQVNIPSAVQQTQDLRATKSADNAQ